MAGLAGIWRAGFVCAGALLAATLPAPLAAQHQDHGMPASGVMTGPLGIPYARLGSGTTWLPDSTPMRARHWMLGGWMVSLHGAVYPQYVRQGTQRGDRQTGETDWEMAMALRPVAGGLLHLRVMTSAEAWTLGGRGYPLLLQTGGVYRHGVLHDRQHPHGLINELAVMYERPLPFALGKWVAGSLYAGAIGEPALGPVAFMHRPSAANDPLSPLGHHWQDASHESAGVVTAALETRTIKFEGSAFNAREGDHVDATPHLTGGRLDSYAGRVNWALSGRLVASAWWGYLQEHHLLEPEIPMHRFGGSVMSERRGLRGGAWATTLIWGMNVHHHGGTSHAFLHGDPNASPHHRSSSALLESNLEIGRRHAVFGRMERVVKNGEELGFLGGDLTAQYDVRSVVAGYRRALGSWGGVDAGVGTRVAVNFVPQTLRLTYGTRRPTGFAVYGQLVASRPGAGR